MKPLLAPHALLAPALRRAALAAALVSLCLAPAAARASLRGFLDAVEEFLAEVEGTSNGTPAPAALRRRAAEGDAESQFALGERLRLGRDGFARDEAEAVRWIRAAAEGGHAKAQWRLGYLLEKGLAGLEKNDVEARAWFEKSAAQDYGRGLNHLANMMDAGRAGFGPEDALRAPELWRRAWANGSWGAPDNLGMAYEWGQNGLPVDYAKAALWYRRGIEAGCAKSIWRLACLYDEGKGVEKDERRALRMYREIAGLETGSDPDRIDAVRMAMNSIGTYYQHGKGGLAADDAEALRWYRKAAALGNDYAVHNIAWMYENGRGGPAGGPPHAPASRSAAGSASGTPSAFTTRATADSAFSASLNGGSGSGAAMRSNSRRTRQASGLKPGGSVRRMGRSRRVRPGRGRFRGG